MKNLYNRVSTRARSSDERVEAYLTKCRELIDRVDCTLEELVKKSGDNTVRESSVQVGFYRAYAEKFIDQIDRRLLKGETIPQEEKVFSISEEHTRWCSKGKAGKPVELGVPVCLIEDQYQFILLLHHKVMFTEHDVNVAVPIIEEAQALLPDLRLCSFDRGFHSPGNRERLDELLELSALPRKGRLSQAERERERDEEFVEARRQHPAIESAINALDHRGLDRVRTHGKGGFARTVALSILASNMHTSWAESCTNTSTTVSD